jgi:hypothetical protein
MPHVLPKESVPYSSLPRPPTHQHRDGSPPLSVLTSHTVCQGGWAGTDRYGFPTVEAKTATAIMPHQKRMYRIPQNTSWHERFTTGPGSSYKCRRVYRSVTGPVLRHRRIANLVLGHLAACRRARAAALVELRPGRTAATQPPNPSPKRSVCVFVRTCADFCGGNVLGHLHRLRHGSRHGAASAAADSRKGNSGQPGLTRVWGCARTHAHSTVPGKML